MLSGWGVMSLPREQTFNATDELGRVCSGHGSHFSARLVGWRVCDEGGVGGAGRLIIGRH